MAKSVTARFWDKTWRRASSECWPWMGYIDAQGYARLWVDKTLGSVPAQRVSLILNRPEVDLPIGGKILTCPILKSCVNPDHVKVCERGDIGDRILWRKGRRRKHAVTT